MKFMLRKKHFFAWPQTFVSLSLSDLNHVYDNH